MMFGGKKMNVIYPNLISEIAKRGIKKSRIAKQLDISERSLYSRLNGNVSFTWDEAQQINKCFFPDLDINYLFSNN